MTSTDTMQIVEPFPGIFAYYDGRIEGKRLYSANPNWLDDGSYSLGIASYAIVVGTEAIVYDTHISLDHARVIRTHLTDLGVTSIRVVLSHFHDDHIAGTGVFSDCEIIALRLTQDALLKNKAKIETADPPIMPLIMPTYVFDTKLEINVGGRAVELHHFDIHSHDGLILWLPDIRVMLAGDTLEDTVTYISEADHIPTHIAELDRMLTWDIERILPNHGRFEQIADGGYSKGLIEANRDYLKRMINLVTNGQGVTPRLSDFVQPEIALGSISYFAPYENVHADNIQAVLAVSDRIARTKA